MAASALALPASKPLRGPEKVAVLLLAMDTQLASGLLKQFDPQELREITRSAADLGSVPIAALERLIEEFAGSFSNGADLVGSANGAETLLAGALPPEQVSDIMADVLGSANLSIWERLSNVSEQQLCAYLAGEHPQTAAFVLSKLTTACAAKVLALQPAEQRNEMTRRMLALRTVSEPMIKQLETILLEDLIKPAGKTAANVHARMADIINRLDREQVDSVLASLTEQAPDTAEIIKSLLFNFEDIVKLSVKARLVLFEKVPAETVILALRGCEGELRDMILASLAARARRMVEQELAAEQAADMREVLKARRAIADTVLDLSEKGQLDMTPAEP